MDVDHDGIPRPNDCDDHDPKVGIRIWYHDFDHDGLGAGEKIIACDQPTGTTITNNDCDDTRTSVHSGATEICDGLDNDCNGKTDETFQNLGESCGTGACSGGTMQCSTDHLNTVCSTDGNKSTEICDDLDNDCNGQTDEGIKTTFYADEDHDGFGGAGTKKITCTPLPHDVTNALDCDDTNASVYPNAPEFCNGIDDDCNGKTDESTAVDAKTWYADSDQDGFGFALSTKVACTKPPGFAGNKLDCNDDSNSIAPNAKEVCNQLDDNCDGQTDEGVQTVFFTDVDQDGYGNPLVTQKACSAPSGTVENSDDCNDLDKLVHPNALEKCNNVDDNCNGQTDEGELITYYFDGDTDGYGDLSKDVTGCTAPIGYVTNSADCNDGKKTIHPNAIELCDNKIDENCDGITDNAIEASLWYLDADKDGYGNAAISIYACATPTGYTANKADCDDANPLIHPNAIEICKDGIDNDCNGITDTDTKIVTWYLDADKDGFGDAKQSKQDCSQPPGYVENATDCSDTNASIHPGALEICNNGVDDNCDGGVNQCKLSGAQSIAAAQTKIHGNASKLYLDTIAFGDVNGDGKDDLVIGVKHDSATGADAGAIYLFWGPVPSGDLSLDDANVKWTGEAANDNAGFRVSTGDVNGDGKDDILTSAPFCNNTGCVYLILGSANPVGGSLSNADAKWIGTSFGDQAGFDISAGDVNGDGFDDVLIGAPGNNAGSVSLVLGTKNPVSGNLSDASATWTGIAKKDQAGMVVDCTADFNGDGKKDPLIWIQTTDNAANGTGAVCLILGSANPVGGSLSGSTAIWTGEFESDQAGFSISTGDVNGDGKSDILIGAPGNTNKAGLHAGAAYLIFGSPIPVSKVLSGANTKWIGETDYDEVGLCSAIGDTNGDGKDDILITSLGNIDIGSNHGASYLLTGSSNALTSSLTDPTVAKWSGELKLDQLGRGCTLRGDANHDGYKDIVITAPYHSFAKTSDGMIYIIHSLSF